MSEIFIIGISGAELSIRQQTLLEQADLVVASDRLAAHAEGLNIPLQPMTPLEDAFAGISKTLLNGNVAVLASGDPLFFGIASRILQQFGKEHVTVVPALSSMQEAFARFSIPWDDAVFVSLHGRRKTHIPGLLLAQPKTFVFTDKNNSPARIAREILDYLERIGETEIVQQCHLHIAENIGSKEERISSGSLIDVAGSEYSDLNVLCLVLPEKEKYAFGLREEEIIHSRGLITKDEVRAATLHRLRLPRTGVFWDIGGGSGSISIEAALIHPQLTIYTVERKETELINIKTNIRKFSCYTIIPVSGRAAQVIGELPDPDAVFIGGSGGELDEIIRQAADRLSPGGRIVINAVTDKTILQAPQFLSAAGLRVETAQIEVSRTGPQGPQCFNPITIMVGSK